MKKPKVSQFQILEQFASDRQLESDKLSIQLIEQKKVFSAISVFQSKCDFNLSWLYQLSPEVVLHVYSLQFLADNVKRFKRKLKVAEILSYDFIIRYKEVETFEKFVDILKSCSTT